jgi:S-adenosylmethionine:tRNA ribosyltransferase-isomerase
MIAAAAWPRGRPEDERLLWIDPLGKSFFDSRVGALPAILAPGDLVVVNDAATVPASLDARREDGTAFEVRLLAQETTASTRWRAVLFGVGGWRSRTEDRRAPPQLLEAEWFRVAKDARVQVLSVDPRSPRLVHIVFESDATSMWRAIYDGGRPVQYSYIQAPLALPHVQSAFASRPWAVELPSAGRPLTFAAFARLGERGVGMVALTHAAGLSSTGDAVLDALLPLDERFDISAETVRAIDRTRVLGGRVVAVGTTVVRALEGCAAANGGKLVAGEGSTDLRLGGGSKLLIADGLLTGIHERGTSHFDLMRSLVDSKTLDRALEHADRAGYLQHEFGDSVLILAADKSRSTAHSPTRP